MVSQMHTETVDEIRTNVDKSHEKYSLLKTT